MPPALAARLAKLGVHARFDLVLHLPARYEDETRLTPVNAAPAGTPVLVEAQVERVEIVYRPRRQLIVHTASETGRLALRFFNFYPSQLKQFTRAQAQGLAVRAYGELRGGWFGAEMAHPRYSLVAPGEPLAQSLTPVYPTTAGLSQATLRKLILAALDELPLEDTLPTALRERYQLEPFDAAVRLLHLPPPGADVAGLGGRTHPAWRRVKFDELLAQQLSMRQHYRARHQRRAPSFSGDGALWLALASISGSVITFMVDRYVLAWDGPRTVTSTPATLRELGELVGLDATGSNLVVAVPVDAPDRSSVVVVELR